MLIGEKRYCPPNVQQELDVITGVASQGRFGGTFARTDIRLRQGGSMSSPYLESRHALAPSGSSTADNRPRSLRPVQCLRHEVAMADRQPHHQSPALSQYWRCQRSPIPFISVRIEDQCCELGMYPPHTFRRPDIITHH
jgi:hypothetical protein